MSDQPAWDRFYEIGLEGMAQLSEDDQMQLMEQLCYQANPEQLQTISDSIFKVLLESGRTEEAIKLARGES